MGLRHDARKAYHKTVVYKLRQLFKEESRWQRKQTIARNKLADVRRQINRLAEELALEKAGVKPEPPSSNPEPPPEFGDLEGA